MALLLQNLLDQRIVIYALPRGGVIVAAEIAKLLNAPLDLIITRKISHPNNLEYAIGAVAEDGHHIFDREAIATVDQDYLQSEITVQKKEAKRRRELYIGTQKPISCEGKVAILVDDGIATGLTIKAAIKELQLHYHPKKIIVAVPVCPKDLVNELSNNEIKVISLITPKDFLGALGSYYQRFPAISDQQVINTLKKFRQVD